MGAESSQHEWRGIEQDAEPAWFDIVGHLRERPVKAPCPSCTTEPLRYFYWRSGTPGRGGFWVWCTACRRFMHFSGSVPDWWPDEPLADVRRLTHQPDWLDRYWQQLEIARRLGGSAPPPSSECGLCA